MDTSVTPAERQPKCERYHYCPYCGKRFTRKEHLERHIPHHTGAKPFQCTECSIGYNRKDLLQRHIRSMHNLRDPMDPSASGMAVMPQPRIPISCEQCSKAKTKCDRQVPCGNCTKKNHGECKQRYSKRSTAKEVAVTKRPQARSGRNQPDQGPQQHSPRPRSIPQQQQLQNHQNQFNNPQQLELQANHQQLFNNPQQLHQQQQVRLQHPLQMPQQQQQLQLRHLIQMPQQHHFHQQQFQQQQFHNQQHSQQNSSTINPSLTFTGFPHLMGSPAQDGLEFMLGSLDSNASPLVGSNEFKGLPGSLGSNESDGLHGSPLTGSDEFNGFIGYNDYNALNISEPINGLDDAMHPSPAVSASPPYEPTKAEIDAVTGANYIQPEGNIWDAEPGMFSGGLGIITFQEGLLPHVSDESTTSDPVIKVSPGPISSPFPSVPSASGPSDHASSFSRDMTRETSLSSFSSPDERDRAGPLAYVPGSYGAISWSHDDVRTGQPERCHHCGK